MTASVPVVIALDGEWDIYRREELRALLMRAYDERSAVLDFTKVTYADSTVLNELVHMRNHRLERDLPAAALVVSSAFSRVLTITHMQRLWPLYSTLREALGNSAVCDLRKFEVP